MYLTKGNNYKVYIYFKYFISYGSTSIIYFSTLNNTILRTFEYLDHRKNYNFYKKN